MIREFQLHIDPSLYGFKFSDAQYATVKYSTMKENDKISVTVFYIGMGPALLIAITDRGKLAQVAEAAAKANAEQFWKEQQSAIDLSNVNEHFHGAFAGIIY